MRPTTSPPRVLVYTTSTLTTSSTWSMRIPPFPPSMPTCPMATLPASLARSQLPGASRRSRSVRPSGAAHRPSNRPSTLPFLKPRVTRPAHSRMLMLIPRLPHVTQLGLEHTLRLATPPSPRTTQRSAVAATQASHTIAAAPMLVLTPTSTLTRKYYQTHVLRLLDAHLFLAMA